MNSSMVRYVLGCVLKIEGVLLLLPFLVGVIYQEKEAVVYLMVALFCWLVGFIMTLRRPKRDVFYLKEGCVATSLSWIFMSLMGCFPFYFTREIPSFTDALFETISGFTTTGASILSEVESLSHCTTFWRCFTHWIGGMGVLVFLLAVIPLSGGSNINLMRAESPGCHQDRMRMEILGCQQGRVRTVDLGCQQERARTVDLECQQDRARTENPGCRQKRARAVNL